MAGAYLPTMQLDDKLPGRRPAGRDARAGGALADRSRSRWLPCSVLAAVVFGAACASTPPPRFPPRPPDCTLETLKTLPRRPYIELETFSLPSPETMREVLDRVQRRACETGADAVYAPKGGRSYSYAIALKWK